MKTTVANKLAELVKLATEINLDTSTKTHVFINISPHISSVDVRIYPTGWSAVASDTIIFDFIRYWNKDKQRPKNLFYGTDIRKFQEVMKILNEIKNNRGAK